MITRLNCHIPRPYVDARNNCCPPELKTPRAVTARLGRNPGKSVLGFGPSSVQLAADVALPKTPTSVATYTCSNPGYTTTAFAGESGRLAVKSVQVEPAFVVFHTWPVPPVKPITVTYAVLPVASEESTATPEIGN